MENLEFKQPQESTLLRKEKLSDEQMDNLLSSIGNSEAKCATLMVMRKGQTYKMGDIHRELIVGQGKNIGWRMAYPVPFSYCEWSLAPIGLVAKEILDPNLNAFGFVKTDYGAKVGTASAGLFLDFSRRYPDISLEQIFGSTISTSKSKTIVSESGSIDYKKRSPGIRLKIFRQLLQEALPVREIDIVGKVGESASLIGQQLRTLGKNNVINYESSKYDQSHSQYKFSSEESNTTPPPYRGYTHTTQTVYEILSGSPDRLWTLDEMANVYIQRNPTDTAKKQISIRNLKLLLSGILSDLNKNGYITVGKFHGTRQSVVALSEAQKIMLSDLVRIIDGIKEQDPLIVEEGLRLSRHFLSHPEEVSSLMAKAREKSSMANRTDLRETRLNILSIVGGKSDISPEEIRQLLESQYDKKLKSSRVREIIKGMVDKEVLWSSKEKNISRLRLLNQPKNKE